MQIQNGYFIKVYTYFGKTWFKISLLRQYQIVSIFKKLVVKQKVEYKKRNIKIIAIFNRYKNNLEDFIDSLDLKSPDQTRLIDKRSYNICNSKSSLARLSKSDYLDEKFPNWSSQLAFWIKNL